jgi:hypothetical protein
MMSDDPVCDHCGVGGPTFTAADLEAACRVGFEMAGQIVDAILALQPPADLVAQVEEARK